jgi:hypothetical protein
MINCAPNVTTLSHLLGRKVGKATRINVHRSYTRLGSSKLLLCCKCSNQIKLEIRRIHTRMGGKQHSLKPHVGINVSSMSVDVITTLVSTCHLMYCARRDWWVPSSTAALMGV